ncbi:hypothetical protein P8452_00309 [Trifolium repens]|nr:hypothetical protein P8452_00309 [Trifolium repens]
MDLAWTWCDWKPLLGVQIGSTIFMNHEGQFENFENYVANKIFKLATTMPTRTTKRFKFSMDICKHGFWMKKGNV